MIAQFVRVGEAPAVKVHGTGSRPSRELAEDRARTGSDSIVAIAQPCILQESLSNGGQELLELLQGRLAEHGHRLRGQPVAERSAPAVQGTHRLAQYAGRGYSRPVVVTKIVT
jgi:hypothetical protein